VTWTAEGFGSGPGQAVPLTGDTGYFWFFSSSNVELMVKVLDGRAVNQRFWVFYGGLSDVEYSLTVTDLQTGAREVFHNPRGQLASAADVAAFLPEPPDAGAAGTAFPAAAAAPSQETPLRAGGEVSLNTVAAGNQLVPAVAVARDGSFMTVWTRESIPPSGATDVFGRIFDAGGNPRTGEIRLNDTPLTGDQPRARVAANAAGEFMAVWSDGQGEARRAQARLFRPGGQPLSGVITLAAGDDAGNPFVSPPDVTADPAGGFLTAWIEYGGPGGDTSLVTQRFDTQGGRLGDPVPFDAQFSIAAPRLAAFPGGGFLVTWVSVHSVIGLLDSDLWAQRLDASGRAVGAPFLVNADFGLVTGEALITPVVYADGGFSVIWAHSNLGGGPAKDGLFARRFAADGSPAGGVAAIRPDLSATTTAPAAIALPSGDTWILWDHAGTPTTESGIYSGVFDRAWALQGSVARVNTFASPLGKTSPAVAAAGADAVAVWSDVPLSLPILTVPGQPGGGVFGQRFTIATCAVGSGQLCLGGRFRVEVRFTDPRNGQSSGATPVPLTTDTGAFWFFDPANLELVVKVIDGRAVNDSFWVYYGALSDVEYAITVTDTLVPAQRTYHNPAHRLASGADVGAFFVVSASH
jgi:hypothetical protein